MSAPSEPRVWDAMIIATVGSRLLGLSSTHTETLLLTSVQQWDYLVLLKKKGRNIVTRAWNEQQQHQLLSRDPASALQRSQRFYLQQQRLQRNQETRYVRRPISAGGGRISSYQYPGRPDSNSVWRPAQGWRLRCTPRHAPSLLQKTLRRFLASLPLSSDR
jgi:hypothetical protein